VYFATLYIVHIWSLQFEAESSFYNNPRNNNNNSSFVGTIFISLWN